MTAAAVYGDIGLMGSANNKLTSLVSGITDVQVAGEPPLYAKEYSARATREVAITVLTGQMLSVLVNPSGVFGGLNADLKARVESEDYEIGVPQEVNLEPGFYNLNIGVSATVRGGCITIPLISYTLEADPAHDLQDSSGNDNHASIGSLRRKAGVSQRSIAFEVEPDHIEIPDLGWIGTVSRGCSLWLKNSGDGPMCQLSPNASIELDSGTVKIRYLGSDTTLHTGNVGDTDWHYLLIWIDSSGTIYTWLDTDSPEETSLAVDHGSTWEMEFGRSGSRYWTGTVDEIVLLDARPSALEVTQMKDGQNPLDGSLYAQKMHGHPVYSVITDDQYPSSPARGQTVVTWDGTSATLQAFIDGEWRAI